MAADAVKASLFYRANAKIRSIVGYRTMLGKKLSSPAIAQSNTSACECEENINLSLSGYPRNHNYRVSGNQLIPSFRLYERFRLVRRSYPEQIESFLDIGCCRGFYVLEAAIRSTRRISVGINVHKLFIVTAKKVRQHLSIKNAAFHIASLEEFADNPEIHGGPLQTVLLIGTYHNLLWGSSLCSTAYRSHRQILQRLAQICTDRRIFPGRLELNRLPTDLKQIAESSSDKTHYNTVSFLRCAEEFFYISRTGFLGTYPMFVLSKKNFV